MRHRIKKHEGKPNRIGLAAAVRSTYRISIAHAQVSILSSFHHGPPMFTDSEDVLQELAISAARVGLRNDARHPTCAIKATGEAAPALRRITPATTSVFAPNQLFVARVFFTLRRQERRKTASTKVASTLSSFEPRRNGDSATTLF